MDIDVMQRQLRELMKYKPMLEEAFDGREKHRREVDARAAEENEALVVKRAADQQRGAVDLAKDTEAGEAAAAQAVAS